MRSDHKMQSMSKDVNARKPWPFRITRFIRPDEWVNGLTHLLGVFLAVPGLYMLILQAPAGKNLAFICLCIFLVSVCSFFMWPVQLITC